MEVNRNGLKRCFFYIEPTSIKRDGNKTTVLVLHDYASPQSWVDVDFGNPYSSAKEKMVYDCKKETIKAITFWFHKGQMRGGEVVKMHEPKQPEYLVTPRTISSALFKSVCGKK